MKTPKSPLTINGDILIVSSVVKPFCRICQGKEEGGTEPHTQIGFLTPTGKIIDYVYSPHESPVMMTKDGHGLSFLGHLFGRLEKHIGELVFKDPSEVSFFDTYKVIISIGSHLSNSVTAKIIDLELPKEHPGQIQFLFTELESSTDVDRIICNYEDNDEVTIFLSDETEIYDYGAIVYFKNRSTHFFVISGLGPLGVREACRWFSENYEINCDRFKGAPYFNVIKVKRNQTGGRESLSEVARGGLKTSAEVAKRKRFAVSLSFPSVHRNYVKEIAEELAKEYTRGKVFFDEYHNDLIIRINADNYLQNLYLNQTELSVVMFCIGYKDHKWAGIEWEAIRRLKDMGKTDMIMPFKVGAGNVKDVIAEVDGLSDEKDILKDIDNCEAKNIAELIIRRLEENRKKQLK